MNKLKVILVLIILFFTFNVKADNNYELNSNLENSNYIVYVNPNGYSAKITDYANLIKNVNINELEDIMIKLTTYGNIEVLTKNNYVDTSEYARDYYHNNYGTSSGSLFLIDMYNRQLYIFSDNANYKVINDYKSKIITDNVYFYAQNGDYYNCIKNGLNQMLTLLDGGNINETMRIISSVLLSLSLSFIISFSYILYKNRFRASKTDEIIENCNKEITISDFSVINVGMHSVYCPRNSSSGGSSSSSGSSGGGSSHSSGGGGGHGF